MFPVLHADVHHRPVAEIRYELTGSHIYVPVTINGRGPFHFIFDTGASATVINPERAQELALKSTGSVPAGGAGAARLTANVYPGVQMGVGSVPASEHTMYGIPLDMVARAAGRSVDGVVGYDFFSHYVVEIDYAASKIRLYAPEGYHYDGDGETMPFSLVTNHVHVKAWVRQSNREPVEGTFTIDTGGANTLDLTNAFVQSHDLLTPEQKRLPTVPVGRGVGGPVMGILSRVQELRLGSAILKNPITAFTDDKGGYFAGNDLAGTIGYGILKRFKVIVNYPRKEITFEKNAQFLHPLEEGISGLILESDLPAFHPIHVLEVWQDSPAARAGLRAGDVLLQVNGRSADHYSMEELHTLMRHVGGKVTLQAKRGETTVQAEFVVAPVLY